MARRTLVDIDSKIIKAIQLIGARDGITGVTSAKIAKLCGISHFTCFEHFGTKQGMLDAAAMAFDRKYMTMIPEMIDSGLNMRSIFTQMLKKFLDDPDGVVYYNNYISFFGFNPGVENKRSAEFLVYAKLVFPPTKQRSDNEYLYLWDYLTSMVFYYADKIIHKLMPNTPETFDFIENLLFTGIENN